MAETEGYYQMLQEHIQSLSQSLSATEEASQIRQTARTMLEALKQCIDIMKNVQVRNDLCGMYPRTKTPGNQLMLRDAQMIKNSGMSEPFSLSQAQHDHESLSTLLDGMAEEKEEWGEVGRDASDSERYKGRNWPGGWKRVFMQWLTYRCISFGSGSLDYESDEFFDADTEMLDNSAEEVGDVPREMVPTVSWDVPSDVEEDEDFNDPDDSAGGSTKMILQLSTGSCSCLHTFSLPSRLHKVSQICDLPHPSPASSGDGHHTHLSPVLHA